MVEKIVDIVKEFIEKHFLPSLLSVVLTALIYYKTPYDLDIIVKLGNNLYLFSLFCLILFIIEIFIYFCKKIINRLNMTIEQNKYNRELEEQNIEYIYNVLDTLTPEELDLIDYIVSQKNRPIIAYSMIQGTIYMDSLFDSRQYRITEKSITDIDPYNISNKKTYKKGQYVIQFKLYNNYILFAKGS